MKRRHVMICWITPVAIGVRLPAHVFTSPEIRSYSGFARAPTEYEILKEWRAHIVEFSDGSFSVAAQNMGNTVRVIAIVDEVGPAENAQLTTECMYFKAAAVSISEANTNTATVNIWFLLEQGEHTISFTVPRGGLLPLPNVEGECVLA